MSRHTSRGTALMILGGALLGGAFIVGGAFWAGRLLGSTEPAGAEPPAPMPDELSKLTPAPGETPDFREPFWYAKWVNVDNSLPRYDQVIAGIRVGPTATRDVEPCDEDNPPKDVEFERVRGSRIDIEPGFLPPGATRTSVAAVACGDDHVLVAYALYELPTASDINSRLARGESFFEIPHGGSIDIVRFVGAPSEESSIPAERWTAGTVAGFPAAIGRPIFDEGFGDSMLAVYVDGVMTIVHGYHISLNDLIKIAEGLLQ